MVPTGMISFITYDRESNRRKAVTEIGSTWGRYQQISGPILIVPFRRTFKNHEGKITTSLEKAYFLPDELSFEGQIEPTIRYRGIYKVAVYNAHLTAQGEFHPISFDRLGVTPDEILWNLATVCIGIPDLKGLREGIFITWGDKKINMESGIDDNQLGIKGLSAKVSIPMATQTSLPTKFSFSIDVRGSEQVYFSPLGKTTSVSLSSTWPNPSFIGEFLPESREVNKTGFNAQWKVLHLNRSFPQAWVNSQQQLQSSNFGVELLLPVDHYSNTLRSIKYAVLFVFLTFLVFFFIELFNKKQLHPIQYLLVGSALILFYLLLLSISEYLSFGLAYLISSLGICGLITGYTHGSLADKKITATVASFLVVLYGLLYILLQLQDYALLVGSLGLFLILAIVMYLTRKFNWYATNS